MKTQINTEIGAVNTLFGSARYQENPLCGISATCGDRDNNLHLESAEIDKKHQLKSLLLTDAAVKIVCHGNEVSLSSLTLNGQAAVAFAKHSLAVKDTLLKMSMALPLAFDSPDPRLDEVERLKAINAFEVLRCFNKLANKDHHHFAVFLGGGFAFDLMAIAEQLPPSVYCRKHLSRFRVLFGRNISGQ